MTSAAEATVIEDKIAVRTNTGAGLPFEELVERCKDVGGGRFHKESKTWRYPLSLDICHRLRRVWGSRLAVADPLRAWFKGETAKADQRSASKAYSDATLTRLPLITPALASTLRADQRAAVAWLAEGWRGAALLADHPGTGKTLSTIGAMLDKGTEGPILVVAPRLSVRSVWWHELTRWTNETVYVARGTRKHRTQAIADFKADPRSRKWLIIVAETLRVKEEPEEIVVACNNPQCIHNGGLTTHHNFWNVVEFGKTKFAGYEYPELFDINWAAIVVDESHRMFGSLTVVKGNLAGKGLKRLRSDFRLAISGTPFGKGGRVQGMFGTLHWLWPDEFTSFWRWADIHFEIEEQKVSRTKIVKKIGRLKGGVDEEFFLQTLGPRILRRTKAEVLPNLPEKRRVDVWCEPISAQKKQQESLILDGEIIGRNGSITVDGVLAMITRGKQVANGVLDVIDEKVIFDWEQSCKIDTLLEKMDERGLMDDAGTDKIIIASQFNEFLLAAEYALKAKGVPFFKITGSVSDAKRDEYMEQFQSAQTETRVMLLNSKAGGVSVTLDAADELHMLDTMWDPGDNEQLEDRIHRASRNHQATIYRYLTEDSIDEGIANDVEGRRFQQFRVLDQKRDLEFARALIERKGS